MPKGNLEHNTTTNAPVHDQLKALIGRIEEVNDRIADEQADRKSIFDEAKSFGLDPKIMRIIIRRRAMEKSKRDEQDALVHVYSKATGTPSPADSSDEEEGVTVVAEFRGTVRKDADGNIVDEGMKRTR
jgi:uncharacterized protein (UPF0335 family)